jgi:hypothetical protein
LRRVSLLLALCEADAGGQSQRGQHDDMCERLGSHGRPPAELKQLFCHASNAKSFQFSTD